MPRQLPEIVTAACVATSLDCCLRSRHKVLHSGNVPIREMIAGLVDANHVHFTKLPRAVGSGTTNLQASVNRLSRHCDSPHWSMAGKVVA